MKAVLLAGLMTLGSVGAYAAADYNSSVPLTEESQTSQDAIAEGLIPADQLDAVEYQTVAPESADMTALDQRRDARPGDDRRGGDHRGGDRSGRPGDDRRGGDRWGRPGDDRRGRQWPRPMPVRSWTCSARDRVRVTYSARSLDQYAARRAAMYQCQAHSFVQGCRLLGCARY